MNDSGQQSMQEKMQLLKARYLKQLRDRTHALETLLAQCEKGTLGPDDKEELKTQAHKLAGTGATYGFPDISNLGSMLEETIIDNPDTCPSLFVSYTRNLLGACNAALDDALSPPAPSGRKN